MKKMITFVGTLIGRVLLPLFLISIITSICSIPFLSLMNMNHGDILFTILLIIMFVILLAAYYYWAYKKGHLNDTFWYANTGYAGLSALVFTITFLIGQGSITHPAFFVNEVTTFFFFGTHFILTLFGSFYSLIIAIGVILVVSVLFTTALSTKRKYLPHCAIVIVVLLVINLTVYFNSANYKYQGHGFDYMNGYSSVDLSVYTPYSDSGKLVTLDHEPDFMIENEKDMPVMDGAEACYPVYSAVAKAIYKDIDVIEMNAANPDENGKIVTFYNTVVGYNRLFQGEADMFFGAKPSQSQLEEAASWGVELECTQIGKEAFVFFVNENNPIDNLTSEQVRAIYHGDITNFKEVGGADEEIVAFQRPEGSGSQTMMQYFMGDVTLKEPLTYETIVAMAGVINKVADYYNEDGAIGYTFKYFLEGLNQEENVKILSIDGVYPTKENIQNGTYPMVAGLYCVTVKGNDNPNVQKVLDFLLSEDGQYIIEETGYCPIN